jgi:hypothetical protein
MRARIGADDLEQFQDPQPSLLAEISGIKPEPAGVHVLLDEHGVTSTQRLAISGFGGGLVAALWPGELKVQAEYLYGQKLGTRIVFAALERGWSAAGSPHLAFRNSAPTQRLYMTPSIGAEEYARRWEDGDLREVGAHSRGDVARKLWPWLKQRGYVDAADDNTLRQFFDEHLGRRPAFLRPGLRLRHRWDRDAVDQAGGFRGLVDVIRRDVNGILAAANEPSLPTKLTS